MLILGAVIGAVACRTRFQRVGRTLLILSLVTIILCIALPVGELVIRKLESRFPTVSVLPNDVGGIIALGGAIDPSLSRATSQLNINGNVERLIYAKYLAVKYPNAPVVFSGGAGALFDQTAREGDYIRQFSEIVALDFSRVIIENRSRNTVENAIESKKLVPDIGGLPWILVTSARHMPRAVGVFRKQGWNIIPYPVDYTVPPALEFGLRFQILGGLAALDQGFYEVIGLMAAAVFGHSDAVFPSPRS